MRGLQELGRRGAHRARVRRRRGRRTAARRQPLAGLPERRRHREPADGRGARRGHDGDRQRRPRARDRRPVRDARRDGRPDRRASAPRRSTVAGRRRGCTPVEHATVTDRIVAGTWAFAAAIAGGDVDGRAAAAPTTSTSCWTSSSTPAPTVEPPTTTGSRCASTERLRAFDVVTLPYPGFPTDLQPFAMALRRGRDGHRDDHRERLRGALHVRPGAGPARRRPAHRRPPRGGPRASRCSPARRSWRTTSAPAPRWCSPGWPPRGPPRSRSRTTSTAATPGSWRSLRGLGADVTRVPTTRPRPGRRRAGTTRLGRPARQRFRPLECVIVGEGRHGGRPRTEGSDGRWSPRRIRRSCSSGRLDGRCTCEVAEPLLCTTMLDARTATWCVDMAEVESIDATALRLLAVATRRGRARAASTLDARAAAHPHLRRVLACTRGCSSAARARAAAPPRADRCDRTWHRMRYSTRR